MWRSRYSDKRHCPVCKVEFEKAYGTAQEYCSKKCKQKAYRQRMKALPLSPDERKVLR